jgi:Superfamily II DNA helicase
MLLAYFNEKSSQNCGQCDVCKKKKKEIDVKEQLMNFIASGPKTNEEILTKFITSPKEKILETLQILIEEYKLELDGLDTYKIK